MSDANHSDHAPPSSRIGTPRARAQRGSSARPRGPPSESIGGPHSDDEGFADDQTLNGRPKKKDRAIPKVIDPIGQYVQSNFEDFLEQYVVPQLPNVKSHIS
jgi:DNA replication licensing factor MCM6